MLEALVAAVVKGSCFEGYELATFPIFFYIILKSISQKILTNFLLRSITTKSALFLINIVGKIVLINPHF